MTIASTDNRVGLIREALVLEWITIAWMVIEAVVAIGAGNAAHSITLTAFGLDSVIELISALVLIWRLGVELKHGATVLRNSRTARQQDRRRPSVRTSGLCRAQCSMEHMAWTWAGFFIARSRSGRCRHSDHVFSCQAENLARGKNRQSRSAGRRRRIDYLWLAVLCGRCWPRQSIPRRRMVD